MPNEETTFTNQDRKTLTTVEILVNQLNEKFEKMTINYVEKVEFNSIKSRVDKLENNNTWIVRTIIGFIILTLLTSIIVTKN